MWYVPVNKNYEDDDDDDDDDDDIGLGLGRRFDSNSNNSTSEDDEDDDDDTTPANKTKALHCARGTPQASKQSRLRHPPAHARIPGYGIHDRYDLLLAGLQAIRYGLREPAHGVALEAK